jgi:hypothetical protein
MLLKSISRLGSLGAQKKRGVPERYPAASLHPCEADVQKRK